MHACTAPTEKKFSRDQTEWLVPLVFSTKHWNIYPAMVFGNNYSLTTQPFRALMYPTSRRIHRYRHCGSTILLPGNLFLIWNLFYVYPYIDHPAPILQKPSYKAKGLSSYKIIQLQFTILSLQNPQKSICYSKLFVTMD